MEFTAAQYEFGCMIMKQLLSRMIFLSRWLQAPLYFGLIVVLGVYVYEFALELSRLVGKVGHCSEAEMMLYALDLVDVVMIANLLIMIIVGGYETFVSRLNLSDHPDQPHWLDEVDAGTMKVKVSLALVGISSIHLLRTFIDPAESSNDTAFWQVMIHITLMFSALFIALINYILSKIID